MRVLVFNPDTNLEYDGATADGQGFGGGKTAIVRLAASFALAGHDVEVACHTPGGDSSVVAGVTYRPWQGYRPAPHDLTILVSSASPDLSSFPAGREDGTRVAWVLGASPIKGLLDVGCDHYVAVSRFVARFLATQGVPATRTQVVLNGYWPPSFETAWGERDVHALGYASYWRKGLDASAEILRRLRQRDDAFTLDVFGGPQLWGLDPETERAPEGDGIRLRGMVRQPELMAALPTFGFMLGVSSIPDAGPLSTIDAMRAGCIVVTNDVGGIGEYVTDREDGVVLTEPYGSEAFYKGAVAEIRRLAEDPVDRTLLSEAAQARHHTWAEVAARFLALVPERPRRRWWRPVGGRETG